MQRIDCLKKNKKEEWNLLLFIKQIYHAARSRKCKNSKYVNTLHRKIHNLNVQPGGTLDVDGLIFVSLLQESLADIGNPVLTAFNIQIVVICMMTPYILVGSYCRVGAPCFSHPWGRTWSHIQKNNNQTHKMHKDDVIIISPLIFCFT